ncbi:hypothetical protein, partial [Prevotella falsenii]|uniref:hypothetical protein n=1 Tax=Prevotella falsenii TaxID=515414 RepID=UPI001E4FD3B7
FSVSLSPFISRVARYTPSSRRQTDREIAVNTMSINYEHLLKLLIHSHGFTPQLCARSLVFYYSKAPIRSIATSCSVR